MLWTDPQTKGPMLKGVNTEPLFVGLSNLGVLRDVPFFASLSEVVAYDLKWGRMSDDEIEEDGSDGTMH